MPFNTPAKNAMLDELDEAGGFPITHVGVHTLTDPGTGTNANAGEASGGSPAYARQPVTWGAAASEQKSNSGALTFDVPAGTYGFFTLFNDLSGNVGNYRGYTPMGGATAIKGFGTVDTTLTSDRFLSPGHGLVDTDRVMLYNVFGEALPTGVAEGTVYFVVGADANTFQVSTTSGGAAVDLTALGGGELYFQKVVPEVFAAQGQITVAIGALVLDASAI